MEHPSKEQLRSYHLSLIGTKGRMAWSMYFIIKNELEPAYKNFISNNLVWYERVKLSIKDR